MNSLLFEPPCILSSILLVPPCQSHIVTVLQDMCKSLPCHITEYRRLLPYRSITAWHTTFWAKTDFDLNWWLNHSKLYTASAVKTLRRYIGNLLVHITVARGGCGA